MKNALAVVSVLGLLGASGFVAWSVLSRPDDTSLTSEAAGSFDLRETPPPDRPAPRPPVEELRDAVASPASSPKPIAMAGVSFGGAPAAGAASSAAAPRASAAPAGPARAAFLTPDLERRARASKVLSALLGAPARFLLRASALGAPRSLRRFLADPRAVDAYMNSSLVRIAINSPSIARAILGNRALVSAALASPALQDPATVKLLAESRMAAKMLDCPGVQEALADPAVIRSLASDPATAVWMASNPEAMMKLASSAPALGAALAPR